MAKNIMDDEKYEKQKKQIAAHQMALRVVNHITTKASLEQLAEVYAILFRKDDWYRMLINDDNSQEKQQTDVVNSA